MSGREPVKVVVRLLPPEITEAELLATVDEKHKQNVKWSSFVAGKRYKGEAKPCLNARCYFQFESLAQCEEFTKDYHGHQFVDGQGESFRAVVCIAPYQKAPRAKPQKDPRDGTIEDDPLYKEFLESLANKPTYDAPPNPKAGLRPATPGDTPLLQFMKTRAEERRARADKRRKEREKWRPEGGYIEEDPSWKKSRWRCKECGGLKNLEEDPDERGVFFCTPCWEYWETEEASGKKKKKKKKLKKEEEEWWGKEEEEEEEEDTTSKKKKKKKKKHDKEEEEWWEKKPADAEWTEEWADEGDTGAKKKKKKKKHKEDEEETWYEEEAQSKRSRWKAKSESWQEEAPSKSSRSKKKKDDEWWEETPTEEKASKSSGRRRRDKGEDKGGGGGGSRWVAKS